MNSWYTNNFKNKMIKILNFFFHSKKLVAFGVRCISVCVVALHMGQGGVGQPLAELEWLHLTPGVGLGPCDSSFSRTEQQSAGSYSGVC